MKQDWCPLNKEWEENNQQLELVSTSCSKPWGMVIMSVNRWLSNTMVSVGCLMSIGCGWGRQTTSCTVRMWLPWPTEAPFSNWIGMYKPIVSVKNLHPPQRKVTRGRTSRHGASNSTACSSMARLWKRTRRSFDSTENKLVLYDIFHSSRHWDAIIFIHGSNLSTAFKTDRLKF